MQHLKLDASNALDKERRFVVGILGDHWLGAVNELDWGKVSEIACEEGVVGILYHHLKDRDMLQSALTQLKAYYQTIAVQNLIHLNALESLEHALGTEKISVLTLKGASLLDSAHPGIGMRPMGDLDLMVRPEEQKRFVNLLDRLGYRRDTLIPHLFNKGRVVIDLHIHALNTDRIAKRAGLFPSGMGPVWAKSVPWGEGYQWLRRSEDMDSILLLSQHLLKHSFSRFIWLVDIYELLRGRDNRFWKRLSKRADQLSQGRPLSYTLYLLNGFFGLEPPEGSGLEDLSKGLSRLERGILGTRIRGQSLERMGPLLALFCLPGLKARITFLWETLFPNKEIVRQEFGRSFGGKRAFFYPGRLLQTASLAFRQLSLIIEALVRGQ